MRGPCPGEIAELALASPDQRGFRAAIAARLRGWIGGDGAWFHTVDPRLPLTAGSWSGLDLTHVERARSGWAGYAAELAPLLVAAVGQGAAATTDVFATRERARLPFFVEVARPLGIERSLWLGLRARSHLASIGISRDRGDFRRAPWSALRALAPILALADRSFASPSRAVAADVLTVLSPRERQVLDILVLGYTNAEIGRALGVSVNTVRKQVAAAFRKVGASTRAELVGLALGR